MNSIADINSDCIGSLCGIDKFIANNTNPNKPITRLEEIDFECESDNISIKNCFIKYSW